ncbi:bacteriocin BlpN [Streptococcus pluranimalium]
MNFFYNIEETKLSTVCGGNPAGAAVVGALTCAAGGVKYGSALGSWGAFIGGVGGAAVCGYLAYKAGGG